MHALVAAVLLRVAWLDALDGDAEAPSANGQLGEVEQGIGAGERYPFAEGRDRRWTVGAQLG